MLQPARYAQHEWRLKFPETGDFFNSNATVDLACGNYYLSYKYLKVDGGETLPFLEDMVKGVGTYRLVGCTNEGAFNKIPFLENHFKDPLHPTPDECTLWELEYGFEYKLDK